MKSSTDSSPDWRELMTWRKRSVPWMLLAMAEYFSLRAGSRTWPRPQSSGRCRSAMPLAMLVRM